jgi:hypothetical protein
MSIRKAGLKIPTEITGCLRPKINRAIFYNILPHLEKVIRDCHYRFYNEENLGEFFYIFYVIFVVLLVFILWNTLKMVTRVTETCRC